MKIQHSVKTVCLIVLFGIGTVEMQAQSRFCGILSLGIAPKRTFNENDPYTTRLIGAQFGLSRDLNLKRGLTYQFSIDLKQFTMNFMPMDKVLFEVFRQSSSTRISGMGIGVGGRLNKRLAPELDAYIGFNAFAQTLNTISSGGSVGPNGIPDSTSSRELSISMHSQGADFGFSLNTSYSVGFKIALTKRLHVLVGYEGFINQYAGGKDEYYAKSWNENTQKYDEIRWSDQYNARLHYLTVGLFVEFYRSDFQ